MQAYIITEAEKQALLKELELENFKNREGFYVSNAENLTPQQMAERLADTIHRRMHCIVCRALG